MVSAKAVVSLPPASNPSNTCNYIHVSANTVEVIVEVHAATSASDNEVLVRCADPTHYEIITTTSPAPATIPIEVTDPDGEFDGIYLDCDELDYES